ncbi:hypothetical protein ABBQ38_002564 [Trebouxia sp. C0009 RCD-2024]
MVFLAKNELQLYLSSINPTYKKYMEDLWANEVSSDEGSHKQSGHRKLIVVDEAQSIYDPEASGSRELWDCLKQGAVIDTKVVFLLAAAHGSKPSAVAGVAAATPYQFGPDQTIHLRSDDKHEPALRFTQQEFYDLFDNYCSFLGLGPSTLIHVRDCVADVSDMQPGLVLHVLDMLARQGHANYHERLDQFVEMASKFVTSDLLPSLSSVQATAQLLALRGYLLLEHGILSFVSQLHQQYFRMCHREVRYEAIAEMPQDICKFLKEAVQRMSRKQVADSLNVNKYHQVLERHYQNEFYRAVMSLLPDGAFMSPDVGAIYGVRGMLDFLLLPQKWGFELLRDGKGSQEHADRFEPGGAYSQMVLNGDIVNWVVVDLRSTPRKPRQHSRPEMLHVLFSPDFRSAEIIDTQMYKTLVYLQDTF